MKIQIIATALFATLLAGGAPAASAEESKPEVVGLLFYADWCGSCKVLDPKLDSVKMAFSDKPVLFTRVDATDEFTKRQSTLLANQLGFSEVYAKYAGSTGFMLLLNASTGEILGKLTKTQSEQELKDSIQQALDA